MKRKHYKKRVNKIEYKDSGMKDEVIEKVISILQRAKNAFTGKRLVVLSSALVCVAAVSGYTVGSQVSLPDSIDTDKTILTETDKPILNETEEQAPKVAAAETARYTLAGGAYILRGNLQTNRDFAEKLGLPFHVKVKKKKVKMTRLLVGTFPADKEKVELTRLEAYTSDYFVLRHGKKFSIYAGSFYLAADAKKQKARFMKQGLKVEEVTVQAEMPLYISYIGDFETAEDALLAGRRAESAGRAMPVVEVR